MTTSPETLHSLFRAVGYPIDAPPRALPTPREALEAALEALDHPEARTAEAAVIAMLYAVLRGAADPHPDASPEALRRAGYASDRLLGQPLPPTLAHRLTRWSEALTGRLGDSTSCPPISWSVLSTPARMRRLRAEADPVNTRWQVFGAARVRDELLQATLEAALHEAP